jgi:hypothetical protein
MKPYRFKMDMTFEAESIEEAKQKIARYLLEEGELPTPINETDGWCCGAVEDWHYAASCW